MRNHWTILIAAAIAAAAMPGTGLAQATTYTTTDAAIAIPDNSGGVFTACQTIVVPAGAGTIGDLDIRTAITHTWVGDLTIRLQSPGAASILMLMNRPGRPPGEFGRSADLASATPITFNDAAASARSAETMGEQPVGTACGSTTIVGSTCGPDNYIPAPDATDTPIAGLGTNLAQFNGLNASGTWTLCVADSAGGDTGTLTSWSMLVTLGAPAATPPVFGYTPTPGSTVTATGGTGLIGSTSNLTITPSIATAGTGTGAPATTTLTCTAPSAPFAGFTQTVTAIGAGAISGGPLAGTCTLGAAAATTTLTCSENRGGTPTARTWTLSCPAGTPPVSLVPVDATSTWSLIALMLALFGFAAVAVRRQG